MSPDPTVVISTLLNVSPELAFTFRPASTAGCDASAEVMVTAELKFTLFSTN